MFGAIEAGGTKFICAYGKSADQLTFSPPIPTEDPRQTLPAVIDFFAGRKLKRIGVASFGPLDLSTGRLAKTTPKIAWRGFPLARTLERALSAPIVLDTDVNAALLAELQSGAARGFRNAAYITIGTGIGAGLYINGALVHGRSHPELGHLRIRRFLGDSFPGNCPTHGDCLEGLAAGPAIAARWGVEKAELLPPHHAAWPLEAHYLGQMIVNLACTVSSEVVVIGGGIGLRKGMVAMIRQAVQQEMLNYAPLPKIVPAKLSGKAGVLGAFALAQKPTRP